MKMVSMKMNANQDGCNDVEMRMNLRMNRLMRLSKHEKREMNRREMNRKEMNREDGKRERRERLKEEERKSKSIQL